jgi:hypothetical protein
MQARRGDGGSSVEQPLSESMDWAAVVANGLRNLTTSFRRSRSLGANHLVRPIVCVALRPEHTPVLCSRPEHTILFHFQANKTVAKTSAFHGGALFRKISVKIVAWSSSKAFALRSRISGYGHQRKHIWKTESGPSIASTPGWRAQTWLDYSYICELFIRRGDIASSCIKCRMTGRKEVLLQFTRCLSPLLSAVVSGGAPEQPRDSTPFFARQQW